MNQTKERVLKREVMIHGRQSSDEHRGVVAMLYVALGSMAMVALTPIVLVALMHSAGRAVPSVSAPAPFSVFTPMAAPGWSLDSTGYCHRAVAAERDAWRSIAANPTAYGAVILRSVSVVEDGAVTRVDEAGAAAQRGVERRPERSAGAPRSALERVEPACYGPPLCAPAENGDAVEVDRPADVE